jgi:hypothetical protein
MSQKQFMGIDFKACEGLAIVTKSFQVEESGERFWRFDHLSRVLDQNEETVL